MGYSRYKYEMLWSCYATYIHIKASNGISLFLFFCIIQSMHNGAYPQHFNDTKDISAKYILVYPRRYDKNIFVEKDKLYGVVDSHLDKNFNIFYFFR